jgi:hypothetical protein
MRKTLKQVIERVEQWPEDRQKAAEEMLLEMERHNPQRYRLTSQQAAEVRHIRQKIKLSETKIIPEQDVQIF